MKETVIRDRVTHGLACYTSGKSIRSSLEVIGAAEEG